MAIREGSQGLKESKCHCNLQKRTKGATGWWTPHWALQRWGSKSSQKTFPKHIVDLKKKKKWLGVTCTNSQRRNWQICIAFYNEIISMINKGKAVDTVCHDLSKASDAVSYNIFIWKMTSYSLDIGSVTDWALAELPASVKAISNCPPHCLSRGRILFTIFSEHLQDGTQCIISKSASGIKSARGVDSCSAN